MGGGNVLVTFFLKADAISSRISRDVCFTLAGSVAGGATSSKGGVLSQATANNGQEEDASSDVSLDYDIEEIEAVVDQVHGRS